EPRLGLLGWRRQRSHEPRHERRLRRLLQIARVEIQDRLAGAWVETYALGLDQQAASVEHHSHLRQRLPNAGIAAPERVERLPDLTDGRPRLQQRGGCAQREQLAEGVAQLAVEQVETLELRGAARRQREDARELAQAVDTLGHARRPVTL